MKCLLALAVALLIASGFGMFVAIYSACHYTLTGQWPGVTA